MISKNAWAYCCEDLSLIENYDKAVNDNTQIWRCHHRLEIQDDGKIIYTSKQLEEQGLYYNRPASELIFMTLSEHNALHARHNPEERNQRRSKTLKGRTFSFEHRKHLSESLKGRVNGPLSKETKMKISEYFSNLPYWNNGIKEVRCLECPEGFVRGRLPHIYSEEFRKSCSDRFKGKPKSEETKRKMSESAKKRYQDEIKRQQMSEIMKNCENYRLAMKKRKGEKWYNNGVINIRAKKCPPNFVCGRLSPSENTKKCMSDAMKGRKWWNNGVIAIRALECPEGFIPGRLFKKN